MPGTGQCSKVTINGGSTQKFGLKAWERQLAKRYANLARWERSGRYVRLMAELGVRMNEVFVEWLAKAKAEIESEDSTEPVPAIGEIPG